MYKFLIHILFRSVFVLFGLLVFNTALHAQQKDNITLGILTDCQYCSGEPGEDRFYPYSLKKLDSCVALFNSQDLDAVFHLGDIIDHGFSNYDCIIPHFQKFNAPVFYVLGNHDYAVKDKEKKRVLKKMGMKEAYYSVIIGNWKFIVLNGNDLSFLSPQNDTQKKERNTMVIDLIQDLRCNFMPWNGGIGSVQMNWLESELKEAVLYRRKVVLLCHFPVYPPGCYTLWNDQAILSLLWKYPAVKAYFNGHYHAGNYGFKNGIHFVNFKGMVQTPTNAFAKVTLTADSIFIDGYGREPSRRLNISW